MTPQELKSSILQLAVQGKLVEQRPEEGTGEELYRQIQAEKQKLIEAGTIKKEKPLPEVIENETPFEIPSGWRWVRLGSIVKSVSAGGDKPSVFSKIKTAECTIPVLSNGETNKGIFGYTNTAEITEKSLTVSGRGTIGYAEIRTEPYMPIVRLLVIIPLKYTYLEYIKVAIQASTEYGIGSAVKQLTVPMLVPKLIPLPPLAEQKRIVAKIEELLPYIDRYEQSWSKLEDFNRRFPVDMRKSILQLAIQGKLVEQRPEEGTGEELYHQIQAEKQKLIKAGTIRKEKPLPEIAEDEIPFDIPESWKWVQFRALYSLSNGTASRGSKEGFEYPVLRLADLSNNAIDTNNVRKIKLTDKEFASHKVQEDDLIFIRVNGSKDRVATAFRYTGKDIISYCDHLFCGHKCSTLVDADYIMFIFNCPSTRKQLLPEIKTTAGQNTISQGSMAKILLPLPPLAEQKRIVAKLEEILPLCDRLK